MKNNGKYKSIIQILNNVNLGTPFYAPFQIIKISHNPLNNFSLSLVK